MLVKRILYGRVSLIIDNLLGPEIKVLGTSASSILLVITGLLLVITAEAISQLHPQGQLLYPALPSKQYHLVEEKVEYQKYH